MSTVDIEYENAEQAQAVRSAEANMVAAGVSTTEPVPVDYFGFDETYRYVLPDNVSWVEYRALNEGQRRKYLNQTNRSVKVQKTTGDAIMSLAPGTEKAALLSLALSNWNLTRGGLTVAFNQREVEKFLEQAAPKIIDMIYKEVVKVNSWLMVDQTVEDIDKEIASLQELRAAKLEEEEGKGASRG